MSNVQSTSSARAAGSVAPAKQPFTRFLRKILRQTLPSLYNKVDRLILTALVDLLEGEHRPEIALLVPQLARRAGVSPASATRALARLEAGGILSRWKKKLTQAGRYIWVIALTQAYQVAPAQKDANLAPPCHVTEPCQGEVAVIQPRTLYLEDQHQESGEKTASSPVDYDDAPFGSRNDDELLEATISELEAQWLETAEPPAEETDCSGSPACSTADLETTPKQPDHLPVFCAASVAENTVEHEEALERLRSVGIDLWKARQLAQEHPPDLIARAIETLRYRAGTVRNPAAWVIREIERGGYAPPPTLVREEHQRAQQASKDLQREREEQRLAEEAQAQEKERNRRLQGFHALSNERQAELLEQARSRLRRISPKMADAPMDLERPGPLSALLFELLEGLDPGPKLSGPTPRVGGWEHRRGEMADFSRVPQDPRSSWATKAL